MEQQHVELTHERLGTFGVTDDGRTTITFKRVLKHPIERVWRAVTDPQELSAWFPMLTLEAKLGGAAVMDFNDGDCPPNERNPDHIDHCKVVAYEPPRLLDFQGPTGGIRIELTPLGDHCQLVMVATNAPGEDIRYSIVCGWHYVADCLHWCLDGVQIVAEGYAGPVKMKIYRYYVDERVSGFSG